MPTKETFECPCSKIEHAEIQFADLERFLRGEEVNGVKYNEEMVVFIPDGDDHSDEIKELLSGL